MARKKISLQMSELQFLRENYSGLNLKAIESFYHQQKGRYWAAIGYPESMCDFDMINRYCKVSGLKCAVSPLHDQDQASDHIITDGCGNMYEANYKKAHFHFLFAFGNTTTWQHVYIHCKAMGLTMPIYVSSCGAYHDYLDHRYEDPEKKHIYTEPITYINGFNINDYLIEDPRHRLNMFKQLHVLIENDMNKGLTDIRKLELMLQYQGYDHELMFVLQNENHFRNYIYWKVEEHKKKQPAGLQSADAASEKSSK